jgi:hypothetical protein
LLLQNDGIEFGDSARIAVSSFFYKLEEVFELALFNAIRRSSPTGFVRYQPTFTGLVQWLRGEPNPGVTLRPDITVGARPTIAVQDVAAHAFRVVADAKYRRPTQRSQYKVSSLMKTYIKS